MGGKVKKEVRGYFLILGYLGVFLILIGFLTAIPLTVILFFPEEVGALKPFGIVSLSLIGIGLLLYFAFLFRRKAGKFKRHEEFMLLTLIWLSAIIAGTLPFYFAKDELTNMNFTKAFFEVTSALSTTGMTGFNDYIDVPGAFAPHVFTYHRAQLQFIGGVGLVLLVASVLGANAGVKLYVSEGHSDKLLPNIAKSAKLLFGIYSLYAFIGTLALWLAGMPIFDAICHSMTAVSGGGMSTRVNNVGAFRLLEGQVLYGSLIPVCSLAIEIIIMFLVTLSMISFVLHTFILRGKFKIFFRDSETRYVIGVALAAVTLSYFGALAATSQALNRGFFDDAGGVARDVIFLVVGSFTTSGFGFGGVSSQYGFLDGPSSISLGKPLIYIVTLLMAFGGGMGSCGGGIKQFRIVVCIKELFYAIRFRFDSGHVIRNKTIYRYGRANELDDETIKEAHRYVVLFASVFFLLVISLCFNPLYNAESAAFDVASAMSNTGHSLIDYTGLPEGPLYFYPYWVLSMGMLLGRLEIMPIVYSLANVPEEISHAVRKYRRNKRKALEESF